MKKNSRKTLIAVASATALFLTIGITTYAASTTTQGIGRGQRGYMWSVLTDDQKTQLKEDAKNHLAEKLAGGFITQDQYDQMILAMESGEMPHFGLRMGLMSENMQLYMDKWNALSDEQKEVIYNLAEDKTAIEQQIIDQYEKFGVIDQETANTMKENIAADSSNIRTGGCMPMAGGRGRMMQGRGGFGAFSSRGKFSPNN